MAGEAGAQVPPPPTARRCASAAAAAAASAAAPPPPAPDLPTAAGRNESPPPPAPVDRSRDAAAPAADGSTPGVPAARGREAAEHRRRDALRRHPAGPESAEEDERVPPRLGRVLERLRAAPPRRRDGLLLVDRELQRAPRQQHPRRRGRRGWQGADDSPTSASRTSSRRSRSRTSSRSGAAVSSCLRTARTSAVRSS